MPRVKRLPEYIAWINDLADDHAVARVTIRIERLTRGNPGDVISVGEGVSELKVDYGPGYRVYYKTIEQDIIVLLYGGTKKTQRKDIRKAKTLAKEVD